MADALPMALRAQVEMLVDGIPDFGVDLVTDPVALSIPPEITAAQVRGFALSMSKIVMNGGVGEAVELARSNPRNIPRP